MADERQAEKHEETQPVGSGVGQAPGPAGGQQTTGGANTGNEAGPPAGGTTAEAGEQAMQDAQAAPESTPAKPADVYDILQFALGLLLNQAWIHLGVRAAPGSSETVVDLPKARVAIDTAVMIFDKLRPTLSEAEVKEIELELSNLRINFAGRA